MNTPVRFVFLVIGIVVGVAVLLSRSRDEWVAVWSEEGKQGQIISLLEPRLAAEPDNTEVLATLGRAYGDIGDYPHAISLMQHYIELRPDKADGFAQLADLYKKTGDISRQIKMLQQAVALGTKLPRVLELAALYRQGHKAKEELALLSESEQELKVDGGALLRLAELRNDAGDQKGALRVLRRADIVSDLTGTADQAEARLYLAKILLQSGESAEVVRLGKPWIRQWQNAWLANRLLHDAAILGPVRDASQLADAVVEAHPEIRFYLVRELANAGSKPVARHLLETWVTANPSASADQIAAFLFACHEQDERAIAWQAFGTLLAHPPSIDVIVRFANAMIATYGVGSLSPFWADLPPAIIQNDPMLGARIAFDQGNLQLTKWLLTKVDLASLSKSDRSAWVELLVGAAPGADAFAVLRRHMVNGTLPKDLWPKFFQIAGGLEY
ncbi:MAG TPA: hypothetical protein VHY35_25615 [Stellaceae bacterium]|jgi:tetratricopeptide (TPR) repeat protein|nr:hypothetical protein [Stellaceae bacterium]